MSRRSKTWEGLAQEISEAIDAILEKRESEIRAQKKSSDILAFWIGEGSGRSIRRAYQKTPPRK